MRGIPNSKPYKFENDFTSSNSDGSTTDLSLRSKSQTATTSNPTSAYEKSSSSVPSSNESGKNNDDGSTSESSGGETNTMVHKDSIPEDDIKEDSLSPTPSANSVSNANFLPIQKLSIANMKAHDLEQEKISQPRLKFEKMDSTKKMPRPIIPRKRLKQRYRGRRKCKLPVVASSLGRHFPLPNPKEIELYSQKADAVQLGRRTQSIQDSSSSPTADMSSSESSSR